MKKKTKIRLGREYWHDGWQGISVEENRKVVVLSGSDGFYPLEALAWGGEVRRIDKKPTQTFDALKT
jgi:hypothetical protein